MVDLDHFKRVNNEFGHEPGDQVLRRDGVIGRIGGDEFLVWLPGAGHDGALVVVHCLLTATRAARPLHAARRSGQARLLSATPRAA